MMAEAKELFECWIDAVALALRTAAARAMPQRRILFEQNEAGDVAARVVSKQKGATPPQATFRLGQTPALTEEWRAALRGSQLEIHMRADQVLFRTIDFPKQATDFLDGMVRAQIDRLTPWSVDNAVFGLTAPMPTTNERITLTLAATSRQAVQPFLHLATDLGAASVEGLVEPPDAEIAARPIKIFEQKLSGPAGLTTTNTPRLLRLTLLGAGAAAAAMLAVSTYLGGVYDNQRQELQQRVSQRRAALRIDRPGGSATTLLAKRKQTSPSSVMVLEAISRALPNTTYVTELRIDAGKMQLVGLTRNAPSLIRLLEQSPQFSRAVFFAPTTRDQNDPGERFHIEAHVRPYFGIGS